MKYLVTGKEMKLLDQNTSEHFMVPAEVLMEQAALAFVRKLLSFDPDCNNILIVCGSGNNGADGIAAARLLNQMGHKTTVYFVEAAGKESDLHKLQRKIYLSYRFPIEQEISRDAGYEYIVDAIFGTGLSRNISGAAAQCIEALNRMPGRKIALDISSGISADNGEVLGCAFAAEDTITFSFGKVGQYLWPGTEYSGRVHVVFIGITMDSWLDRKPKTVSLDEEELSLLPKRADHSNKGTYGKLLVVAGSAGMAGAAYFCAKAAYRAGCGLVRILTAGENRDILSGLLPEAVFSFYGDSFDEKRLIEDLKWADAVVAGPGIGTSPLAGEILHRILQNAAVPMVLDADALNLLSKEPEVLQRPHTEIIVTPHLGEMARLTGDTVSLIQTRIMETAQEFARQYEVICVLKDFHTITAVPYGCNYINLSGNHGMATAGSGDVLSGIIGSYLAQGKNAAEAAYTGVYVHGLAGDAARKRCGGAALMATDIIEGLEIISSKVDLQ